jgi:hypothetical protein
MNAYYVAFLIHSNIARARRVIENPLDQISLVVANYNDGIALDVVLYDWFKFLGGKPNEVLIIDGGSNKTTQSAYQNLFNKGYIDKLQLIQSGHKENDKDTCYIQEYYAGALASNPYVLWFKFDTLASRSGHDQWLSEAIEHLETDDVFAYSGAFNRSWESTKFDTNFYKCSSCTINFALMKRSVFMNSMQEYAGDYILNGFSGTHEFGRFLIEKSFIAYMKDHDMYTICKIEDETWTIFHTNAHEEKLIQVREKFLARDGLKKYMNPALSNDPSFFAYYGSPIMESSLLKKAQINYGRTKMRKVLSKLKKV